MISVITPVYNASNFLDRMFQSVLELEEVGQHVVVDDGSTDDSWEIIKKWAAKDSRILIAKHPDSANHGRSASRNLGISLATLEYVAFLDADDYFLPNRFERDLRLLESHQSVDGVYNAIGVDYDETFTGQKQDWVELTTMENEVSPDQLFFEMSPIGNSGWFSGDGLTVRKGIFQKVGTFNLDLDVGEDTELWLKMALKSKLIAGIIDKAVAMRGVHDQNVFNQRDKYRSAKYTMMHSLMVWAAKKRVSQEQMNAIWPVYRNFFKYEHPSRKGELNLLLRLIKDIFSNPSLMGYDAIRKYPKFVVAYLRNPAKARARLQGANLDDNN